MPQTNTPQVVAPLSVKRVLKALPSRWRPTAGSAGSHGCIGEKPHGRNNHSSLGPSENSWSVRIACRTFCHQGIKQPRVVVRTDRKRRPPGCPAAFIALALKRLEFHSQG